MVTCYLRYIVDAYKLKEFEHYGKLWIPLVEKFGGQHHGYFLPSEGTNNVALAMFTFPSLAAYEKYRADSMQDPECQAAFRYAEETRCILSYERSFFRPVFKSGFRRPAPRTARAGSARSAAAGRHAPRAARRARAMRPASRH